MSKLLGLALLAFSSATLAADIKLTWDKPTEREDGTAIQEIEKYNLYYTINNVLQDVIEVDALSSAYLIQDIEGGTHTMQLSTVERGLEGGLSDPLTVFWSEATSPPSKIVITGNNITIELLEK